jgi:hypothetical protein
MSLDPIKDVFIQFSRIKNDELVKWYHIKYNADKYVCSSKPCPTHKGLWRRQPAYLILHRKNNSQQDNRLTNIEYRCPNCYFQDFGPKLFTRVKKGVDMQRKRCANACGRVLPSGYTNSYCYGCQQKIKKYDSGPSISELVKLSSSLNKIDSDEDEDPDEMSERIAAMQAIYGLDLELEADMKRSGIALDTTSQTSQSTTNNIPKRHSTAKVSSRGAASDINVDMTGVLDALSDSDGE